MRKKKSNQELDDSLESKSIVENDESKIPKQSRKRGRSPKESTTKRKRKKSGNDLNSENNSNINFQPQPILQSQPQTSSNTEILLNDFVLLNDIHFSPSQQRKSNIEIENVKKWLMDLGLEEYISNFLNNGYDTLNVCANLSVDDFSGDGLNINKKGHQKRLLLESKELNTNIQMKKKKKFVLKSDNTSYHSNTNEILILDSSSSIHNKKQIEHTEENSTTNPTINPIVNPTVKSDLNRTKISLSKEDINKYAPIYDIDNKKSISQIEELIHEEEIGDLQDQIVERSPRLNISMTPPSYASGHSLFKLSKLTPSQDIDKKVIHLTPPKTVSRKLSFSPEEQSNSMDTISKDKVLALPIQNKNNIIIDLNDEFDDKDKNNDINNTEFKFKPIDPIIIELDTNNDTQDSFSNISILFEHLKGSTPYSKNLAQNGTTTSIQGITPNSRVTPSPKSPKSSEISFEDQHCFPITVVDIDSDSETNPVPMKIPDHNLVHISEKNSETESHLESHQSNSNMIQGHNFIEFIQNNYYKKCENKLIKFQDTLNDIYLKLRTEISQFTEERDKEMEEFVLFHDLPTLYIDSLQEAIKISETNESIKTFLLKLSKRDSSNQETQNLFSKNKILQNQDEEIDIENRDTMNKFHTINNDLNNNKSIDTNNGASQYAVSELPSSPFEEESTILNPNYLNPLNRETLIHTNSKHVDSLASIQITSTNSFINQSSNNFQNSNSNSRISSNTYTNLTVNTNTNSNISSQTKKLTSFKDFLHMNPFFDEDGRKITSSQNS